MKNLNDYIDSLTPAQLIKAYKEEYLVFRKTAICPDGVIRNIAELSQAVIGDYNIGFAEDLFLEKCAEMFYKQNTERIQASDIYTIQVWYGESITEIFLTKEAAEEQAKLDKERWHQYQREIHKDMTDEQFEAYFKDQHKSFVYKVQDLSDAVLDIINNYTIERESDII
jgi:hypothetical protein